MIWGSLCLCFFQESPWAQKNLWIQLFPIVKSPPFIAGFYYTWFAFTPALEEFLPEVFLQDVWTSHKKRFALASHLLNLLGEHRSALRQSAQALYTLPMETVSMIDFASGQCGKSGSLRNLEGNDGTWSTMINKGSCCACFACFSTPLYPLWFQAQQEKVRQRVAEKKVWELKFWRMVHCITPLSNLCFVTRQGVRKKDMTSACRSLFKDVKQKKPKKSKLFRLLSDDLPAPWRMAMSSAKFRSAAEILRMNWKQNLYNLIWHDAIL